ncbi:MAG: DUF898 family protein [Bdellovibrionia bacterium]
MDQLVPASEYVQRQAGPSEKYKFKFVGKPVEMAIMVFSNILLTLVTLGIYNFWAKTRTRKYIRQHLEFAGDRFNYTGTGKELFLGFIPVALGLAGIILFQVFLQKLFPAAAVAVSGLFSLGFGIAMPYLIYWSTAYKLSRTNWRNIRFGLSRKGTGSFVSSFLVGYILLILTLGLYMPYWHENMARAMIGNMRFGSAHFVYHGTGKQIFFKFWAGIFLSIITLGLFLPWHSARMMRYRFENIQIQGAKAKLNVSGGEMFKLFLIGYFGIILSLGLAMPWIMHYSLCFFAERIELEGALDFTAIAQIPEGEAGAGSDMAADALDISIGF